MRYIDMQTWSRRNHFRLFSTFNHPHFSMCVNMDITAFYPFVKRNGYSLTISMVYIIARASNAIPEFRQRIRGEQVVEHEIVNPGFSILVDNDLFSFCFVEYVEIFCYDLWFSFPLLTLHLTFPSLCTLLVFLLC